ncbi:MAG: hypothetical protein ACI9VS_002457 [Candidatus Binatia bacterium]|jgi:hypothetical protein
MKSLRVIIGFAVIAMIVALVVQSNEIRALKLETVSLRKDLKNVLAVQLDDAPPSTTDQEQVKREKLELIKLRHEVRDLRETMAAPPNREGLRGLVDRMLPESKKAPSIGELRPEWKGQAARATNLYARAIQGVTTATNEYVRFLSLNNAAKMSLAMNRTEDARKYATDMLTLDDKYSRGEPSKSNGDVIHNGNVVLGRIAVDEGRLDDARRHLLAAGKSKGSPVLGSFGPNMSLAKDLLAKGEQETVLQYFEECRVFWKMGGERLDEWTKDVHAGRIPAFGASLIY